MTRIVNEVALLSRPFLPILLGVTPFWPEDFVGRSLEELIRIEIENRAWNHSLRSGVAALVDSRLAKNIDQEEYAARRQEANEQAVECKRRRAVLLREIRRREGGVSNSPPPTVDLGVV